MPYHPGFGASVGFKLEPLSNDPDQATAETVTRMDQYAVEDSQSPIIAAAVHDATGGGSLDRVANDVFWWIKRHVRFVPDAELARPLWNGQAEWVPEETEVLIRPRDLLRMRDPQGDCDDFSMLAKAMLLAAGIPTNFVTVAADRSAPDVFSHVYVESDLAGVDVPLDTSHGPRVGWEAAGVSRRLVWGDSMMIRLHGLAAVAPGGLGYTFGNEAAGGAGGAWWERAIQTGLNIAQNRYGVPPQGTFVQDPQGNVISRTVPGAVPYPPGVGFGVGVGGGLGTGALLIGAAVVLGSVLLFSGGRRGR